MTGSSDPRRTNLPVPLTLRLHELSVPAREREHRPQSILSLVERADTKVVFIHKEPECEKQGEWRLSRMVL